MHRGQINVQSEVGRGTVFTITLRQQLAEKERMAAPSDGAFVMGDQNLTDAQREKLHKLDDTAKAIRSGDDVTYPAPSGRRWQTGFGWKRRWHS